MREAVNKCFGFVPCTWQLEAALTQLGQRDLVTLAPTGSGKTLTFWIPLLFNGDGITIVITPLIVLGEKNVKELSDVSIAAINLTTTSTSEEAFKEIESLKYRVVITSPERILNDQKFLMLWKSKRFVNKLRSFIFDEAHCISQWSGDFRPDYANVGRLRWMVPSHVAFYAASATMPHYVLSHVKALLQMRSDTREIRLSNDRPNIHLVTLEMLDPLNSCHDITRVLRFDGDPSPPPFMVFCNDRKETERICLYARSLAPASSKLRTNKIWGIFCTDAAGMGLDLRDIEIVIQWRYMQSLCMLWQRLGRAARDPSKEATGIYMVEPQYLDKHRMQADKRVTERTKRAQQKRPQGVADTDNGPTCKRVRSQDEKPGHSRQKKSQTHVAHPEIHTPAPQTADNLIVKEDCHESYEVAAMDTYINARQRGVFPTTVAPRQSRAPNKFKVDSGGYTATELDHKLKESLCDWRHRQLQTLGVTTGDDMFGPQLIMTDEVLECIVDLAHFGQVDDLETLQSQVSWRYCDRWGPQIFDIIKTHAPPVATSSRESLQPAENLPGPSTGLQPSAPSGGVGAMPSGSKPRTRSRYRCGSCGSTTHIGKLFLPNTPLNAELCSSLSISFESHVPKPQITRRGGRGRSK
ncbi:P-loop containing nucleoside triphosphate hydrolase protein [Lactarius psammicola]|nr:P-loop containing nucleoside triphosphate hydrolase protein [Lactarius psammicola]